MKLNLATTARAAAIFTLVLIATIFTTSHVGNAQQTAISSSDTQEQPFVEEYYYKTKWGHSDEFLTLFKKNHYPVLKREIELGRILKVSMSAPRLHATEDGRWDYRVTIVFKNSSIANDNFDSAALLKQLYPDQETYKKEEQRRFEILDGHWDVPIKEVDLDKR